MIMELKIGRHTYEITNKDIFVENNNNVLLKTQSKEKKHSVWDWKPPSPKLSQKAIKEISKFNKILVKQNGHVRYFRLDI